MSETDDPLSPDQDPVNERLSALLDGELDLHEIAPLSAAWGRDEDLREQWQTWGLIGDVLRTGAQARDTAHDQKLFEAIRTRLADEPVVLAPNVRRLDATVPGDAAAPRVIALPRPRAGRMRWSRMGIPAAGIAAGLAFVGVMVWKLPQPLEAGRELASAPTLAPAAAVVVSASSALSDVPRSADAVSDPPVLPMQPYLQAHRAMTAGFAIDPGPGQLRRVAQEQVAR
ncbi:sigma-E factor negative regulatory protein [Sphaerotilus mobilis]|uniref:RseA-like anti sigma(E) protein n=1 Tax=Sphaerotilus mobilis TaxID=47994 RepID=A0A4Q7LAC1_9BURK|nr:sigma-E factor negative regulatory protein [Sphaerotilus mobilis]RZS47449.1 RseA-like anti sigma(E) protein [Sphaerotilus mobilis]